MDSKRDLASGFRTLPLLWLSLAFIAGILLAAILALPTWAWLLATMAAAGAVLAFSRRSPWLPLFALGAACVLFAGATRYQVAQPSFTPSDLAFYNDTTDYAEIQGVVSKAPVSHDSYLEFTLDANELMLADEREVAVRGRLLVRAAPGSPLHYGDRVRVYGQLQTPNEDKDFSYRDYLARQGIHSIVPYASVDVLGSGAGSPFWAALFSLRQRAGETLYQLYSPQSAALLSGILLGDESGLSDSLTQAFNDTCTRHIIAISGFNISIIAGIFLSLGRRWLSPRRGIWAAAGGVALYTLLVGAEASVVRAAIMGLVGLVALYTGRQTFAVNTLAITAALMALLNPPVLWDVGFQLSFAATLGIVLYAERMRRAAQAWLSTRLSKRWAGRLSAVLNDVLFMTLAAQLATLPILLFYFQRFSLVSLPANILVLPVQPAVMILGGLSALLGMLVLPLGQLVALVGSLFVTYTIRVVEFLASFSWVSWDTPSISLSAAIMLYAALVVVSFKTLRDWLKSLRIQPALLLSLAAVACFWIWQSALAAPQGELQITLLDVEGEAILIQSPSGRTLLVNAGSSLPQLSDELGHELASGQTLDWLLITGSQVEQIGALSAGLERLPVEQVAWRGNGQRMEAIVQNAEAAKLPVVELNEDDGFDLGDGATLRVLAAGDRGTVLLLEWREFSALLPVGLDFDLLDELGQGLAIPPVDLLLLADAGYPPLNPPQWIANLAPQVIWVAASQEPLRDETLAAVAGYPFVRADEHGWLRLTTDGDQYWVEVAR